MPSAVFLRITLSLILYGLAHHRILFAQQQSSSPLDSLLQAHPQLFASVLKNAAKHRLQIMYTQIHRDNNNVPHFTTYQYRLNDEEYFYPASTVKFPVALLALEKLDRLGIKGISRETPMLSDSIRPPQYPVHRDTTARSGYPSIEHYVKKILLVSDNEAYNRLFEFVGRKTINNMLADKGFRQSKIIKRLSAGTTYQQDFYTNPIRLIQIPSSPAEQIRTLYSQDEAFDSTQYTFALQGLQQGKGVMRGTSIVPGPIDFTNSNYYPLRTMHDVMLTFLFPETQPAEKRFRLNNEDRTFVLREMGKFPRESDFPSYDSTHYDGYCKFFVYGDTKARQDGSVRIFNKVGDAYGYLIDCAYIVDFKTNTEFMLAATIHVNDDEIFNDDKYEYETIGFPFLANLGRIVLQYEQQRTRVNKPNLKEFELLFSTKK